MLLLGQVERKHFLGPFIHREWLDRLPLAVVLDLLCISSCASLLCCDGVLDNSKVSWLLSHLLWLLHWQSWVLTAAESGLRSVPWQELDFILGVSPQEVSGCSNLHFSYESVSCEFTCQNREMSLHVTLLCSLGKGLVTGHCAPACPAADCLSLTCLPTALVLGVGLPSLKIYWSVFSVSEVHYGAELPLT